MDRRFFLRNAGLAIGSAVVAPQAISASSSALASIPSSTGNMWAKVRSDFILDHHHIQMAQMLLASHPARVRDAIAKHRKAFDESPALYWEENFMTADGIVAEAASRYMECDPGEVGLTDSTTQSMSLLFNGFKLEPGEEVLATTHDHYITDMSVEYACQKKGATFRRIAEFADPASVTVDEVVTNIREAIRPETRVVVVTWVQSCTGVKLPIRAIADMIKEVNAGRDKRIYFCVDGVHGFGNQADSVSSLGCDFFAAGTHKWIYGPRGTGIAYAKRDAWDFVEPTIPAFSNYPYMKWLGETPDSEPTFHELCSPGGFHAFEHRWSLNEAFEYQLELGRDKVHARTTELNTMLKAGLKEIDHIELLTPTDPALSAGINCFIVDGYSELETVKHLHDKGIVSSSSPYKVSYARLTPCIINTEVEVAQSLKVLEKMA